MDQSEWLGLLVGAVIGTAYAWLQVRAMLRQQRQQQRGEAVNLGAMFGGSILRVALLVVALAAVVVLDPQRRLDRMWLLIGVAAAYSVPIFWRLKHLIQRRK
jgi:NhaP-type Na+/H+ or K+/H+ antiporter